MASGGGEKRAAMALGGGRRGPPWPPRTCLQHQERDGRQTGLRRKTQTGTERLRPPNFEGRSQPASGGYIPSGAAPLPPLSSKRSRERIGSAPTAPIQTVAGADRLRSRGSPTKRTVRIPQFASHQAPHIIRILTAVLIGETSRFASVLTRDGEGGDFARRHSLDGGFHRSVVEWASAGGAPLSAA
jgi:hypothetical protein